MKGANGPVVPSVETIKNGTYTPLSRPVFIYVSDKASQRLEVDSFVTFYLQNASALRQEADYDLDADITPGEAVASLASAENLQPDEAVS